MIPTNLPPGTELVCIDAVQGDVPIRLVKNNVYTVRGYSVAHTGYVSVLLEEERAFTINSLGKLQEVGYYRDRFRLLILHHSFIQMLDAVNLANTTDA